MKGKEIGPPLKRRSISLSIANATKVIHTIRLTYESMKYVLKPDISYIIIMGSDREINEYQRTLYYELLALDLICLCLAFSALILILVEVLLLTFNNFRVKSTFRFLIFQKIRMELWFFRHFLINLEKCE